MWDPRQSLLLQPGLCWLQLEVFAIGMASTSLKSRQKKRGFQLFTKEDAPPKLSLRCTGCLCTFYEQENPGCCRDQAWRAGKAGFWPRELKLSSQSILSADASGYAIVSPRSLGGVTLCLIRRHASLTKRLGKTGVWQTGVPDLYDLLIARH